MPTINPTTSDSGISTTGRSASARRCTNTTKAASRPRQNQSGACWVIDSSRWSVSGAAQTSSTAVKPAAHAPATCHTDHAARATPARAMAYGIASQTWMWAGSHFVASSNSSVAYQPNSPSTTFACGPAAPSSCPITGADTASASRFLAPITSPNWTARKIR